MLTSLHKKIGNLGLLHTMKEFLEDLYDVIKILTVILDVNNSGIFFHMFVSYRGTFVKLKYFLFYFCEG